MNLGNNDYSILNSSQAHSTAAALPCCNRKAIFSGGKFPPELQHSLHEERPVPVKLFKEAAKHMVHGTHHVWLLQKCQQAGKGEGITGVGRKVPKFN